MANVTNFRFALNASVDASPTFKKFGGEEVASNFIIVSDDETSICTGTAINDSTRDGKPGIRVDLKLIQGSATTFFNGILMPKTSDNPKAPQHGGVLKNTKSGVEVSVSGWSMTGKSGDFMACRAEVKSSASTATSTDAANAELATAASENPGH